MAHVRVQGVGRAEAVALLLRHGARPDDVVSGVIESGPPNLLAILLRAGADPNVLPNSPFPPLFYAASLSDDRSEVVRVRKEASCLQARTLRTGQQP